MVRNYIPKRKSTYSKDDLLAAMQAVRDGETIAAVAKRFNIPRMTLSDKLKNNCRQPKSSGGQTILTNKQEESLVQRVLYMADRGFPLTINWLRSISYFYVKHLNRRR